MATKAAIPPKPKTAPTVHLKGQKRKPPRTLKGDLKALKGKLGSATTRWTESQGKAEEKKEKVRQEAEKILAPVKEKAAEEKKLAAEVMKPVQAAAAAIKNGLDPANGKTRPYVTSFMISSVMSWAVGPQILTALYERIRFGTSTTGWGILNGPGRWFRDTIGMAYESDRLGSLIWAAVMGLTPMILMFTRNQVAGYLAQSTYRGRMVAFSIKWLTRSAWLVPVLFFVGVSYPDEVTAIFGSPWTFQMWQFWVAGLFCMAFYATMWVFDRIERLNRERSAMSEEEREKSQSMGPGIFHAVLMIPLASIVTGILLYAPGAAW